MNVIALGLNHHSAAVETRERFAVGDEQLRAALRKFTEIEGVHEAVIVSTCNRVEFYAAGPDLVSGYHGFSRFLEEHSGLGGGELEAVYRLDHPHSVNHLYRVVCGIDSMVLGETEILGQVKKAYASAVDSGMTSRVLNRLFQSAFRVAKQVRSRTSINRGSTSVGSVAVELAERIFGNLEACRVLIIGAGDTAERTARSLISRGAKHIHVANRSQDRASALAESLGGAPVPFDNWRDQLGRLDILITCTAATAPIVRKSDVEPFGRARGDRPLFVIDLAVPRDVEPAVNELENVFLYDIDSLEGIARRSIEERKRELAVCEAMIGGHVGEFSEWLEREESRLRGNAPEVHVKSGPRLGMSGS